MDPTKDELQIMEMCRENVKINSYKDEVTGIVHSCYSYCRRYRNHCRYTCPEFHQCLLNPPATPSPDVAAARGADQAAVDTFTMSAIVIPVGTTFAVIAMLVIALWLGVVIQRWRRSGIHGNSPLWKWLPWKRARGEWSRSHPEGRSQGDSSHLHLVGCPADQDTCQTRPTDVIIEGGQNCTSSSSHLSINTSKLRPGQHAKRHRERKSSASTTAGPESTGSVLVTQEPGPGERTFFLPTGASEPFESTLLQEDVRESLNISMRELLNSDLALSVHGLSHTHSHASKPSRPRRPTDSMGDVGGVGQWDHMHGTQRGLLNLTQYPSNQSGKNKGELDTGSKRNHGNNQGKQRRPEGTRRTTSIRDESDENSIMAGTDPEAHSQNRNSTRKQENTYGHAATQPHSQRTHEDPQLRQKKKY